jgi:hypothetical protein
MRLQLICYQQNVAQPAFRPGFRMTVRAEHRTVMRRLSHLLSSIGWKDWLFLIVLTATCCIAFSATLSAQDTGADDELRAAREHGQNATGVRTVNCLIQVRGVEYLHGFCTFIPSDKKDGSFTLVEHVHNHFLRAEIVLSAPASKDGVAYWSGPDGGRTLVELGPARSEGACWRVGDAKGKDETRLCAWNAKLAVDEPTPKEPPAETKDFVYYGMRTGMYDAISSRDGIDTDHARIVTDKSRAAAIISCRSNHDFTSECIAKTLQEAPTPILTADCPAGTFTDALGSGDCDHCEPPQGLKFLGKNPHSDEGAHFLIQYLKGGDVMDGSWASTYDFAIDAYALLCPKTLEAARSVRQ